MTKEDLMYLDITFLPSPTSSDSISTSPTAPKQYVYSSSASSLPLSELGCSDGIRLKDLELERERADVL